MVLNKQEVLKRVRRRLYVVIDSGYGRLYAAAGVLIRLRVFSKDGRYPRKRIWNFLVVMDLEMEFLRIAATRLLTAILVLLISGIMVCSEAPVHYGSTTLM